MTLQIIENLLTATTSSDNMPTWLMVIICVVIFFIAGFTGGVISYNAKLKKLRENKETPNDDDSNEKNTN